VLSGCAHQLETLNLKHVKWYPTFKFPFMSFFNSANVIINGGSFASFPGKQDASLYYFSFQALLLTVFNTAGALLEKTKDCESDVYAQSQADDLRERHLGRSLDGLMVCQQAITAILFHDHTFVIDHKGRRRRPA
jgi:hypothetical protein